MLSSDVIPVLCALFSAAGLVTMFLAGWFYSRFPIHIFEYLSHLSWFDGVQWPLEVVLGDVWLRSDWEDWMAATLPTDLAELLSCPYCLAFHASVWASCFSCVVFGSWIGFLLVFAGAYVLGLGCFRWIKP